MSIQSMEEEEGCRPEEAASEEEVDEDSQQERLLGRGVEEADLDLQLDGNLPDSVRETLGVTAAGLAEQLKTITEEMNSIRQELYGDAGLGGIAKELEKLKASGLVELLGSGTESVGQALGAAQGSRPGAAGGGSSSSSSHVQRIREASQCGSTWSDTSNSRGVGRGAVGGQPCRVPASKAASSTTTVFDKIFYSIMFILCLYICWPQDLATTLQKLLLGNRWPHDADEDVAEFEF